jgi:hypothetical protein
MRDEQFLTSGRPPGEDEMTSVSRSFGDTFAMSRLGDAIQWARKYSFFSYPFVTACCGMEYMAVATALRPRSIGGSPLHAATSGSLDGGGDDHTPSSPGASARIPPDGRAALGDVVRCLHELRRSLQQLRRRPRHRHHHSGRHLRAGLPAASASRARRSLEAQGACGARRPGTRYEGRHGSGRPMQD